LVLPKVLKTNLIRHIIPNLTLDQEFRLKYPQIEWKKIAGMRDKLIHDYIGVDLWAVWGLVEKIIPDLDEQIQEIIKKEEGGI
jgi:uncharacterized protein with HEPN domain